MGSEQQSEEGNKEDYITLQVIQESLNIKDTILFKKYLQEIFNDLSNRGSKNKNIKYMSRTTFYDYIKLPIFIAEKLFSSFSNRNKDGLVLEEFVDGLFNLYTGSFEDTAKIIFNLLDFNKDGLINNDDVKIILSYLPLNNNNNIIDNNENKKEELVSKIFGEQMKSLEEIDEIVKNTFNRYEGEINFVQFIESIKNNNSEVYLQILCFLYEQIPFTSKNIDCIKKKYYSFDEKEYEGISIYQRNYKKKNSIQIKTPKKSSMLSPAGTFLNKRLRIRSFTLNEEAKQIIKDELNGLSYSESKTSSSSKENNPSIKNDLNENKEIKNEKNINNIDIVRFDNENIINEINSEKNKDNNSNNVIDNLCKNSKKNYVSPTKYLQEKVCLNQITLNGGHIENQLRTIKEESEIGEKTPNSNVDNNNEEQNICYENWIYKITEENKIKKFYLVLINKDIFYYSSEEKKQFLGMHNLSGCFIQDYGEKNVIKLDGKEFYKFELYFNNKSKIRQYYALDYNVVKEFVKKIKESIGYLKFSDFYEIKQVIGKGKFGVVNLGIHKKTGQQIAIKIMNKENIKTSEDKEFS